MLVVEGPLDTNYTGVVGGKLVSASAEAEASAEQQGRPQHKIALIQVDHMLSNGADQDVVVNVTASEQARSLTRCRAGAGRGVLQARSSLTIKLPALALTWTLCGKLGGLGSCASCDTIAAASPCMCLILPQPAHDKVVWRRRTLWRAA